ncbi:MAG: alpha/beta hydrolase [Bacteroidales bacterium]|nr:alpha/beta hydrolase [Bacteroidales bacterium]
MAAIKFKKKNIFYSEAGKGKPIVFLHGFTETSKIWKSFSADLAEEYRVICIDLPGHGKSETVASIHTMELLAEVVYTVLKKLKIGKCLMVGHSMGGYTTLAFAAKYPEKLKGFCLFHSHCFPDTPDQMENRNRTIHVVDQDKFSFIAQFIPALFPPEVHKKFAKEIEKLIQQAAKMPKEAVIAALEGMKSRKDQSEVLKTTDLPILFILGLKDAKAPVDKLWEMVSLPHQSEILLLHDCGHMGYIEYPEETMAAIQGFAKKIF